MTINRRWLVSLLGLSLMLAPAVVLAAAPGGIMNTTFGPLEDLVGEFLQSASDLVNHISTIFAGPVGLTILAACIAIRIAMTVLPGILESDLSKFFQDVIPIVCIALIVSTLMRGWGSIIQQIWAVTDNFVYYVASAYPSFNMPQIPVSGDPLPAIAKWMLESTMQDAGNMMQAVTSYVKAAVQHISVFSFQSSMATALLLVLVTLVSLVVLAMVMVSLLIECITSWAHILAVMIFGPLVLSFHPLLPAWTRNLVSELATGIITLMTSVLLLVLTTGFIEKASTTLVSTGQQAGTWPGAANVGQAGLQNVSIVLLMLGFSVVIWLIGKASGALSSVAAKLVGGSDSFSRHRGAGLLAAGMAAGAGMKVAQATGAAATGGATAAAGGASAAVGGLKNLATGHTKARLNALKTSRAERDAASAARAADRNAGVYRPRNS